MQIKHTINQNNIQYSKTHDFGEIKNICRQIYYTHGLLFTKSKLKQRLNIRYLQYYTTIWQFT